MFLSFDLAILFLEFAMKIYLQFSENKFIGLLNTILFVLVKYWEQPKC